MLGAGWSRGLETRQSLGGDKHKLEVRRRKCDSQLSTHYSQASRALTSENEVLQRHFGVLSAAAHVRTDLFQDEGTSLLLASHNRINDCCLLLTHRREK